MKKFLYVIVTAVIVITGFSFFNSCQSCTRIVGSTTSIELKENQKFLNVTWKESDIWVLTQSKDNPKEFRFSEYSNFGVFEGEVIITEK